MDNEILFSNTHKAAKPLGHYSQAVSFGDLLFLSLQLGISYNSKDLNPGSIEEQTVQAMNNVQEILLASNCNLEQILRVSIYLSDIDHWAIVDRVYQNYMKDHKPARSVVPCGKLHNSYDVGIEVTAYSNVKEST